MKVGDARAREILDRVLTNTSTEGLNDNLKILHLGLEKALLENPVAFFKRVVMPMCNNEREVDVFDLDEWSNMTPAEQARAMDEITQSYEQYREQEKLTAEQSTV